MSWLIRDHMRAEARTPVGCLSYQTSLRAWSVRIAPAYPIATPATTSLGQCASSTYRSSAHATAKCRRTSGGSGIELGEHRADRNGAGGVIGGKAFAVIGMFPGRAEKFAGEFSSGRHLADELLQHPADDRHPDRCDEDRRRPRVRSSNSQTIAAATKPLTIWPYCASQRVSRLMSPLKLSESVVGSPSRSKISSTHMHRGSSQAAASSC